MLNVDFFIIIRDVVFELVSALVEIFVKFQTSGKSQQIAKHSRKKSRHQPFSNFRGLKIDVINFKTQTQTYTSVVSVFSYVLVCDKHVVVIFANHK